MGKNFSLILRTIFSVSLLFLMVMPSVVFAEKLSCAFGQDKPPFIIGKEKRGIEVDLVREALAYKGHTFTVKHLPNKRLQLQVPKGKSDCAVSVRMTPDLEKNVYYSDHLICYDNYVITRKDRNISRIRNVADLKGLKLVAWQNAHRDLGPQFYKQYRPGAPETKRNYKEAPSQLSQHKMFLKNRMDGIIVDLTIFKYYMNLLDKEWGSADIQVDLHKSIFKGLTCFQAAFSSFKIRNDFNAGLRNLRKTGRYDKIVAKGILAK